LNLIILAGFVLAGSIPFIEQKSRLALIYRCAATNFTFDSRTIWIWIDLVLWRGLCYSISIPCFERLQFSKRASNNAPVQKILNLAGYSNSSAPHNRTSAIIWTEWQDRNRKPSGAAAKQNQKANAPRASEMRRCGEKTRFWRRNAQAKA